MTLHVGLMKSGTSSIQRELHANREWLAKRGVEYPDLGQVNQMLAFVEPLRADEEALERFPPGLRRHLDATHRDSRGLLGKLGHALAVCSAPRVLVSAENLVYAGDYTRRLIRSDLWRDELRVVVTRRRLSSLIPSNYQQQARIHPMPDIETWAREEIRRLSFGDVTGSLGSLRTDLLVEAWSPIADQCVVIDTDSRLPSSSLQVLWESFTGLADSPVLNTDYANLSWPVEFIEALQRFMRLRPDLLPQQLRRTAKLALPALLSQHPRGWSRWAMASGFARVLDEAGIESNPCRAALKWREVATWLDMERIVVRRVPDAVWDSAESIRRVDEAVSALQRVHRRLWAKRAKARLRGYWNVRRAAK